MTNALIAGDGPAGLAAAIILGQLGKTVTVVRRPMNEQHIRAGESLASSALLSLTELGLSAEFLAAGHEPCYGNSSCWGNDKLSYYDFIQSTLGNSWYIDRQKLHAMLYNKAIECRVSFITAGRTVSLEKDDDIWHYHTGNGNEPIAARMIVDASGRNSWFSRRLGIERVTDDKQIAAITLLATEQPVRSHHSIVEAVKDGWWYVAGTGNDKTVCIFFTDADLHKRGDLADPAYLDNLKKETRFVKHRVAAQHYRLLMQPQLTAAASSHLSRFSGPGWIAAGDAACAMDPVSAHGIAFALRSGIDAAIAANDVLNGTHADCALYDEQLHLAMDIYKEQRRNIYRKECRWPAAVYWKRRRQA